MLNLFNREQILVAAGVCDILCGLQGHCEPADFHLLFLGENIIPSWKRDVIKTYRVGHVVEVMMKRMERTGEASLYNLLMVQRCH